MILSVSRRTDIPRFYFDWFLNRLQEGFVLVRNPMNHHQVSRIALNRQTIECIAFWTKNPKPMLSKLQRLEPYPYFIQFTINPYGNDIENGLPKKVGLLETFKAFSEIIGPAKMVWRYSPILLNQSYTMAHHIKYFEEFARRLKGYTDVCRISFLDIYKKIAASMERQDIRDVPDEEKPALTKRLIEIGSAYGIAVGGCGNLDLQTVGLAPVGCIDSQLVARVIGKDIRLGKDPSQRNDCYCMPSIDIGTYNTCLNGCVYCYANQATANAGKKAKVYNASSPILCDTVKPEDQISNRNIIMYGDEQLSMF